LRIDDKHLSQIKGDGFMTPPNSDTGSLNTGDYLIDPLTNTVDITGCQMTSKLTSEPYGSVTFFYLKLPDTIGSTEFFQIDIFSDPKRAMKIIESNNQLIMSKEQLAPGLMELNKF